VAYTPEVNHQAIAGLWKLTQIKSQYKPLVPMKEFTVFPKDKERERKQAAALKQSKVEHEMLLMLKEDGSFQQYSDDDKPEEEVKIPDKLKYYESDDAILERFYGRIKGKWEYLDGKLILAADRPADAKKDTLLVGKVVATSEESLAENPILRKDKEATKKSAFDTHLSVPKGQVNVGRFVYPNKHPSFFEQPMFQPKTKGKFELKQVLGSLNAQTVKEEEQLIELFRQKDFHDKSFLLTSYPIEQRRPKGTTRWSIKYNKYVEDPPSKKAKREAEEAENRAVNIRVMEVRFFANNTFATVGGLGDSILRGKYHIVGNDRDQLWMQVWRFGFGRSVSGSVYSEGKSLTKEDEKTYWGKICYEDEIEGTNESNIPTGRLDSDKKDSDDNRRLLVKGSVIFGYGLEPQPVGRFVMSETTGIDDDEQDDEDDSEDGTEELDDFSGWSDAFQ